MALKIDFLQSIYAKITEAFNNSTVLKEGGMIQDKNIFPSYEQLLRYGGILKAGSANIPATSQTYTFGSSFGAGGSYIVPPGKAAIIRKINASADGACYVLGAIKLGLFASTSYLQTNSDWGETFGVNGGKFSDESVFMLYEGGSISCGFSPTKNSIATGYINTSFFVEGCEITADFDFDASKKILLISDSIGWTGMGNDPNSVAYRGDNLYIFRLKKALELHSGKKVHIINKGFGGAYSTDVEKAISTGYYDGIDYDLIICAIGMNDASVGAAGGSYTTSLNAVIEHRDRKRPNASIIFAAPSTTDTPSRVPNVASFRAAMQSVVSASGGSSNKIHYVDFSNAYGLNATASADVNFAVLERSAGARLHPSGIGQGLLFNTLYPVVQSTDFYMNL